MAAQDFISNSMEVRKGATACLHAMRIVERINRYSESEDSAQDYQRSRDMARIAMTHAAGEHSEFMCGFIATFAEYASLVCAAGEPDLYVWKPECAMTDDEIITQRAGFAKAYEE